MKLCVLGSGSKGNAVYVEAGRTRLMFDVGLSALQIRRRLSSVGVDPADYVLQPPTAEQESQIATVLDRAVDAVTALIGDDFDAAVTLLAKQNGT